MASSLSLGLLLGFLLRVVFALEVTPGSSCAIFCMDDPDLNAFDSSSSTTNTSDIVCKDTNFGSNASGIKFQNCLECLQKSKKENGTESDLHWYLYNLRYTISTCLYSAPVAPSFDTDSPCVIDDACGGLRNSVTYDNLTSKADTYGYCDADNEEFMGSGLKPCISCLQSSGNQIYLSNFMIALEAGCEQKPEAGSLLSLSGTVFTNGTVNITTPAVDITTKPAGAGSGTMTKGTIAGIAIGTALFFLGAVALFIVYWRRQKAAKKQDDAAYRSNFGTPDPFLPPQTKMSASLRSYSAQSQYENGRAMANGDYYDLLEKEARTTTTTTRLTYNRDPRGQARGLNSAMPTHQAYNPAAMSRAMQAPHHPLAPQPTHQRHTSIVPDALSLQTYMNTSNANEYNGATAHNQYYPPPPPPYNSNANTDTNTNINTNTHTHTHTRTHTMTTSHNAPAIRPPSMTVVPPPPAGPPPAKRRVPSLRVPSLSAPSVPKVRMPKQYTPPMIVIDAAPVDEQSGVIATSGPVMSNDPRFKNIPLTGGVVYPGRAPARGE